MAALTALARHEEHIRSGPSVYHPKPLSAGLISYAAGQETLARAAFVSERPDDERRHRALGLAYAGLGLREAAIQEGRRAVELLRLSKDAFDLGTVNQTVLAQIYAIVGEYDAAIEQLDLLLSIPSYISVPLLRVDPTWDPSVTNHDSRPCWRNTKQSGSFTEVSSPHLRRVHRVTELLPRVGAARRTVEVLSQVQ